jgi:hypothetical protein
MIRFVVLVMILICATGLFCGQSMAQGPTTAPPREAPIKDSNLKEAFFGQAVGTGIRGFETPGKGQLSPLQPAPAPPLAFEDQFARTHRINEFPGDILVLIYGDRASADANRSLGETIHLAFHPESRGKQASAAKTPPLRVKGQPQGARTPEVHAIPVAVIGRVPSFAKGLIQNRFKAAVSDTPVWLDFEDRLKNTWGIVEGHPNLVVIDHSARMRTKGSGQLSPPQIQQLVDTIEVLRRESLRLP